MAEDEQDDAARAFEDLTAEVRVMRRAMEALEAKKPTDYAPTLAALTQELEKVTVLTVNMTRSPAMRLTPDSYAAQIGRAQDEAARPATAELQRVQTLTDTLERALGGIRMREEQRRWVWRAAISGLVVGALLSVLILPSLVRALPIGLHVPEKLTSGVIDEYHLTSRQSLMPSSWRQPTKKDDYKRQKRR